MTAKNFEERLKSYQADIFPVVPFKKTDRLLLIHFTEKNNQLTAEILDNTDIFIKYINAKLNEAGARYGIGGYKEHRTIYSRSKLFGANSSGFTEGVNLKSTDKLTGEIDHNPESLKNEPRRIHLGIDIWGKPYTKVMAPFNGIVHSFAFNNAFGDYGTTIVLVHNLDGLIFHTLYGHLSLNSIKNMQEGDMVMKGDVFAEFGIPFENGHWPPHLHFQIIQDMHGMKGDYPGVCKYSEKEYYLENSPDPDLILQMMQYVK